VTLPFPLPVLGILNDCDAPEACMLAVGYGNAEAPSWSYVTEFPQCCRGIYRMIEPAFFTPLALFGCIAAMRPDGKLLVTQINISVARYRDGTPRFWQGQPSQVVDVRKHVAGEVIAALQIKQRVPA
jgi:hypothetical protein